MKKKIIVPIIIMCFSCMKETFIVNPRSVKEAKECNAFIKEFVGDKTMIEIENKKYIIEEVYLTYKVDSKKVYKQAVNLVFKFIDLKSQQINCPDDYTRFEIVTDNLNYNLGYQARNLISRIPIETTNFTLNYHDDNGIKRFINFKEKVEN